MITASNAFISKVNSDSRTFRARFLIGGSALSCDVNSITVNKGAGAEICPGTIYVPYIEAEIANCDVVLEGKDITLQIGVKLDNSADFSFTTENSITVGSFTVIKAKKTSEIIDLTAVGFLNSKCGDTIEIPVGTGMTAAINQISSATGLTIQLKGLTATGTISNNVVGSCRDALGEIACLLGGYVTEDNLGHIVIAKYGAGDQLSVSGDRMITPPELNSKDYYVTGIEITGSDQVYVTGTPNVKYETYNMTQALFAVVVQNLLGYGFRPGMVEVTLGDPRLEPWDSVAVTDSAGVGHTVPCLQIRHIFDGGIQTEIDAAIESDTEADTSVKGAVTKAVENISIDLQDTIEEVGTKAGLDDIGQRNLIRNSKTMLFTEYGYDADGLTDAEDVTLTDEEGAVLQDQTQHRKQITSVGVVTSLTDHDTVFINQNNDIKQIALSQILAEGDKTFVFEQATPSDTWTITHGLGKYPSVTVVDSAGSEVVGDYDYTDTDNVTLTFYGAFAGKAYLN